MNSKLVFVLTIVCAVLVLIIAGEWLYAVQAKKRILAPTVSKETTISLDEMPGIELLKRTEESYADLVAKPLFIKGRKPVDEHSHEEAPGGFAEANKPFDWQLNGVYSRKKVLFALFSRSTSKVPKDSYRKLTTDADLDGWKLAEIHKDRVLLKQGNQQKELLLRKPKDKDPSRKANMPKIPNAPNMPNMPPSPQPPAGDFENSNNEQF